MCECVCRGVDRVLKMGGRGSNLYIYTYMYVFLCIIMLFKIVMLATYI